MQHSVLSSERRFVRRADEPESKDPYIARKARGVLRDVSRTLFAPGGDAAPLGFLGEFFPQFP